MSNQLADYESYNVPNWDGYDAQPITPATLEWARVLASLLERPPDIAPGGDGTIGFEWVSGEDECFLDISESGIQIYMRHGDRRNTLHTQTSKRNLEK